MSNQNWAYANIGNYSNTVFGFVYVILPFVIIGCLTFVFLSKNMKKKLGDIEWIILIILGVSFLINYSRGLVRHSLYEMQTMVIVWTAYIFISYFYSCYKNNKKIFLPLFMLLILCNTLFMQDRNFNAKSVADNSVVYPEKIIESWTVDRRAEEAVMTFWEQIKEDEKIVQRVQLSDQLNEMVCQYQTVLDTLLDKDETFVDYTNKTILYALMGRENPVYVSQSPLQLSGEYAQEQFVEQIKDVPLVIMPVDPSDFRASISLDGISNIYRYYIVSEYIYQKYVPLCQYEEVYAVWCLKSEYNRYAEKLDSVLLEDEYIEELKESDKVVLNDAERIDDEQGVTISSVGSDPMIGELQKIIDLTQYEGKVVRFVIKYRTEKEGNIQMFYTTEEDEGYNNSKVKTEVISGEGDVEFAIPITKYSRIRIDIPSESQVTILSLATKIHAENINYGYDGPYEKLDDEGIKTYVYRDCLHKYNLNQLPWIWGSYDVESSNGCKVVADIDYEDGIYSFDNGFIDSKQTGNYLKIRATYNGKDNGVMYQESDESIPVTIIMGNYENDNFVEKCRYEMSIKEGTYDYLIRVSADYYWYLGEIDAIKMETEGNMYGIEMEIIEE